MERRGQAGERLLAIGAVDDDLGEHRIVVRRHLRTRADPGVDAHPRRERHLRQQPRARPEPALGVLGVHAHLDGMAARLRRHELERITRGDFEHPLHEIDSRDLFRHGMLDLQARIHLEKEELARLVIEHELDRSGRAVADGATERDRPLEQRAARVLGQARGRRLLDHLLVPALRGAITLAERNDAARAVAEDLHLHVPRPLDEALEEQASIAEVLLGERACRAELVGEGAPLATHLHADPAAARRALHDERESDAQSLALGIRDLGNEPGARQERDAELAGERSRAVLGAEAADLGGSGSDEREPRRLHPFGELGVLR